MNKQVVNYFLIILLFSCSTNNTGNIHNTRAVGNFNIAEASRNVSEIFESHINSGKDYEENGNINEAIKEYLFCLQMINGLEYGYYFLGRRRDVYNLRVNQLLFPLYEKQGNYQEALKIINNIISEIPNRENYLNRSRLFTALGFSVMAENDRNIANRLERVYYVSARGNDTQNDGRSEQTPFATLGKALDVARRGTIKTVIVIGYLTDMEEDNSIRTRTYFSINNNEQEILIIGKNSGGIIASGDRYSNSTVINVSGNFRFANIVIAGGETGIVINSGSNVIFDTGVIITENTGGGSNWLYSPRGTGILNNGNLIIQGDAKIINNSTASGNSAGGISNNGTLIIKDFVLISGNKAIENRDGGTGQGGGILNNGTLTIQDNVVISNNSSVTHGGGIYNNGTLNILGGEILNNNSKTNGGGIYNNGTITMRNGKIYNNIAEYGAGVYVSRGTNVIFNIINGRIENNNARFAGGGIYVERNARFSQNGGDIINNLAGDGDGNNIFRQ